MNKLKSFLERIEYKYSNIKSIVVNRVVHEENDEENFKVFCPSSQEILILDKSLDLQSYKLPMLEYLKYDQVTSVWEIPELQIFLLSGIACGFIFVRQERKRGKQLILTTSHKPVQSLESLDISLAWFDELKGELYVVYQTSIENLTIDVYTEDAANNQLVLTKSHSQKRNIEVLHFLYGKDSTGSIVPIIFDIAFDHPRFVFRDNEFQIIERWSQAEIYWKNLTNYELVCEHILLDSFYANSIMQTWSKSDLNFLQDDIHYEWPVLRTLGLFLLSVFPADELISEQQVKAMLNQFVSLITLKTGITNKDF